MEAPCKSPCTWCYGCCCPCCFAHQQREKLLDITGEPYICCAGLYPCSCCNQPCESRQPYLFCETCCCTSQSILANRFMLQTRFDIRNDSCDDTLLSVVACLNCVAILVECFGSEEAGNGCRQLIDCVNASVCACMLTQQDIELKNIEESLKQSPYQGIKPHIITAMPPAQQEMVNGFARLQATAPSAHVPYGATATLPPAQVSNMPAVGRPSAGAPVVGIPVGPHGTGAPAAVAAAPVAAPVTPGQMMISVPQGCQPGQMIQFTTPNGVLSQVAVPPGMSPGM